jgi:hypothetical protein
MFSIGPFHRSLGQPEGTYVPLLPLEPVSLESFAGAPAAPRLGRQAVAAVLLLVATLAVQSAVGWWTIADASRAIAPSALGPIERAPS